MGATVSRCLGIVPYAQVVASESSEVSVEELERMMRDVAQELGQLGEGGFGERDHHHARRGEQRRAQQQCGRIHHLLP